MDSFVAGCLFLPFGRKKMPVRRMSKLKINQISTLDTIKGLLNKSYER